MTPNEAKSTAYLLRPSATKWDAINYNSTSRYSVKIELRLEVIFEI